VIALSIVAALGIRWFVHDRRMRWAQREAMPEVVQLMAGSRPLAVLRLLRRAEAYLPATAELVQLKEKLIPTGPFSVETAPPGAEIYVKEYSDSGPQSRWELLGQSPARTEGLAVGHYRWRAIKKGWEPVERGWTVDFGGVFALSSTRRPKHRREWCGLTRSLRTTYTCWGLCRKWRCRPFG
jgi:hypothetical protein